MGTMRAIARVLLTATVLALVAAGCSGGDDLPEGTWLLLEIEGETVPAGTVIDLTYDGSTVTGSAGCNQYTGSATLEGGDVDISEQLAVTLQACDPATDEIERRYLDALMRATKYEVDGDTVTFSDDDGTTLAEFATGS